MRHLNYSHLLYFWTVAREGGVTRAAQSLNLTPQTVSGQLRLLEEAIGAKLFARTGRRLVLTETGHTVYRYADEMFTIGAELAQVVRGAAPEAGGVFNVGITDVLPKLVAYRVLETALALDPPVRMVCHEGKLDRLLADLAVHAVDLVLSDSPVPEGFNVRAYNHLLGESAVALFAAPALARRLRRGFPGNLNGAPMVLPTRNTALRRSLELWLEREAIAPRIVCECEDSALIKAFGEAGAGVIPVSAVIEAEARRQYSVALVGRVPSVRERFYAISAERRLRHPAVVAVTETARRALFDRSPETAA